MAYVKGAPTLGQKESGFVQSKPFLASFPNKEQQAPDSPTQQCSVSRQRPVRQLCICGRCFGHRQCHSHEQLRLPSDGLVSWQRVVPRQHHREGRILLGAFRPGLRGRRSRPQDHPRG